MSDIVPFSTEIAGAKKDNEQRPAAVSLQKAMRKRMFTVRTGKKQRKMDVFADMLVGVLTMGQLELPDGRVIALDEPIYEQWLKTAKLYMEHVDGPAKTADINLSNNLALYKVYADIDVEKI